MSAGEVCLVEDCGRPARRGGYCWAHVKRCQRHGRVLAGEPVHFYASPWERLLEAAIAYAYASTEDDGAYLRARERLRKAADAFRDSGAVVPPEPTAERLSQAIDDLTRSEDEGARADQPDQIKGLGHMG